jgi:hypothetical protein
VAESAIRPSPLGHVGKKRMHAPAPWGASKPPRRQPSATEGFTHDLPSFSGFDGIGDPERFARLPDDWSVGVADVVASTEAIAAGRYRSVNTAGAAIISAVSNALGTLDFPFIFAGDGASFAVAPADAERAARALAATVAWVASELDLRLRGAMLPVSAIRGEGLDVRVARFAASADVSYAMFSGGGLAWAERQLKTGRIALPAAPPDARPDLSGLSCRFRDIGSRNGLILSMLVRPLLPAEDARFRTLIGDLLALIGGPEASRPLPGYGPLGGVDLGLFGENVRINARPGGSRFLALLRAAGGLAAAALTLSTKMTVGPFSARRYMREVIENSDFRKYEDGLMMTLDCSPAIADALEERLKCAHRAQVAVFGLHRQGSAMVTCLIPSVTDPHHVHFIDGAAGGYAMAASDLKSRLSSPSDL